VPGVEKCGPKTAVKWLTEYGTLDNLVANADKVGGKVGENLRKHLDFLPLGRKLVTVVTDLPLPVGPPTCPPGKTTRRRWPPSTGAWSSRAG
jgi:DNA polymerase-1